MATFAKSRRLFWAIFALGLLVRLGFMFRGGSHYFEELFLPFIDSAVREPFFNPWLRYPSQYFPYGSVLFLILFVPKYLGFLIFGEAAMGATALSYFLMKLPLLAIDLLFLRLLKRFVEFRGLQLLIFYWLNPILIYITYVHGQLDIASMYFLVLSLAFLFNKKYMRSGIFYAAALLSKFHVALLIPIILTYILKSYFTREAVRNIAKWATAVIVLFTIGFLPHIFAGQLGYSMTTSPEALRIFAPHIPYGNVDTLLLGVLVISLMLGRLCLSTSMSSQGLLFASGLLMASLLVMTLPMPGWFFWVIPFLALLTAINHKVPRTLWVLTIFFYFAYFGVFFESNAYSSLYKDICFTLLQACLIGWMLCLWHLSVNVGCPFYKSMNPVMLGVAGDSGAGKNHFSIVMTDFFSKNNLAIVEGDDYHKWERGNNKWTDYTHLHPRANHLESMVRHMDMLVEGKSVFRSQYDHSTGAFSLPRELKPSKTILVQGLLTFYMHSLRKNFDLKIFLDPDPRVRLQWKIARDVTERGHSPETVLASLEARKEDAEKHIDPQKKLADWIVQYFPVDSLGQEKILKGAHAKLGVRYLLWNDVSISPLVNELNSRATLQVTIEHDPNFMDRIIVEMIGDLRADEIEEIAQKVFPNLRVLTRSGIKPQWRSGYDGIHQLTMGALLAGLSENS